MYRKLPINTTGFEGLLWYPVIFTGSLQGRITSQGDPCFHYRKWVCSVNNSGLTTMISICKKHHWSKLSELWIERENCIKDTTRGVPSKIRSIFLAFQHQVVNPKFQYLTQGLLYFWLLLWQLWQSNWYVDSHTKNLINLLSWKLHNPSHSHLHCKYILCNF